MPEYVGNIHIHSTFSDGSEGIDSIVQAAHRQNLDFICITDHRTLAGKEASEKWWGKTLVLVGSELNRKYNHYLALGIKDEVPEDDDNPQRVIDAVNEQGGIGIIAHPCEVPNPAFNNGMHFPWKSWDASRFDGIEVWNCASQWREYYRSAWLGFLSYHLTPLRPLEGANQKALKIFDNLCQKMPLMMVCGSDAHALKLKKGVLRGTFFPYDYHFRVLNTHLLLSRPLPSSTKEAAEMLLKGIRNGSHYIALDGLARAEGLKFFASNGEERYGMGDRFAFTPRTELEINAPKKNTLIKIIKNGKIIYQSRGPRQIYKVSSRGTYRVEIFLRYFCRFRPWIYTNPIYII